eukprot:jgi/Tetstr1/429351/TSEL_019268.t1
MDGRESPGGTPESLTASTTPEPPEPRPELALPERRVPQHSDPPGYLSPVRQAVPPAAAGPLEETVYLMEGAQFWDPESLGSQLADADQRKQEFIDDLNTKTKWDAKLEVATEAELEAAAKQHAFLRKDYTWVRDRHVNRRPASRPPTAERLLELSGRLKWGEGLYRKQAQLAAAPPVIVDCSKMDLPAGSWFTSGVRPRVRASSGRRRDSDPATNPVFQLGQEPPLHSPRRERSAVSVAETLSATSLPKPALAPKSVRDVYGVESTKRRTVRC